jgi:hypothetical protein
MKPIYENEKLDKAFNIDGSYDDPEENEIISEVRVPTDPELASLNDIIRLALEAYKMQVEDIGMIEPKNRVKYLEVAERYLNQAKDAINKRDALKVKLPKKAASTTSDKSDEVDVRILYEEAKKLRSVK